MIPRPFGQELRDVPVELLVRRPLRLGYVVVDLPHGYRFKDRFSRRPVPPLEQQCPLGIRVKLASVAQELGPGHPGHPPVGEHDGDLLARFFETPEHPHARLRRALADDAVVSAVAIVEFVCDLAESIEVVVDGDQHRPGCRGSSRAHRVFTFGLSRDFTVAPLSTVAYGSGEDRTPGASRKSLHYQIPVSCLVTTWRRRGCRIRTTNDRGLAHIQ